MPAPAAKSGLDADPTARIGRRLSPWRHESGANVPESRAAEHVTGCDQRHGRRRPAAPCWASRSRAEIADCRPTAMTNVITPGRRLSRRQRRRLLGLAVTLLSIGALRPAVSQQARPSDARSGPDPELRKILIAAIAEANSFADRFDAEVWLTDMSHRLSRQVPDPTERLAILKAVHRHATHVDVPPELVLGVIDVESNFDRFAISATSALGLMQVMPFWIRELGYKDKNALFNIETNVLLGCQILKFYLQMERGSLVQGLARYNGSVGRRWYSDRVLDRVRTKWFRQ